MTDGHVAGVEMRKVFGEYLTELAQRDQRIVVLDNDSDATTASEIFRKRFPDRFLQMGISEKNIFGTAAGLATTGLIPFPSVFATMAVRCALDQIAISISYANLNVKIPGGYVGGSKAGASHIPIEDIAVMRALPNMRVADPADAEDLKAVMRAALKIEGPVYFRVSKLAHPQLFESGHDFEWGKGVTLSTGTDVTLFGTGMMTALCLAACHRLAADGISAEVVHLGSIKPLDVSLVVESAGRTGAAVVAENASIVGGLGAAVAETLGEHRPTPVYRIGYRDAWIHSGAIGDIVERHCMTPAAIAEAAMRMIAMKELRAHHGNGPGALAADHDLT
jgi:transketolase